MSENCKVLNVKHCGPLEVTSDQLNATLNDILATLQGEIVVQPGDQWQALLQAAFEAADISVTIDGQPISVVVDTSAGPVEVTGTVTVNGTVSVDNFPTSISIDNFADLAGVELTVTLDGEVVTVTPDAAFIAQFESIVNAIDNTIRVDWEPTGMCVVDADGNLVSPAVKQFIEKRYDNVGNFLSNTVVLSQYNEDGSITGYTLGTGEKLVNCPSDIPCVLLGTLNKYVAGTPGLLEEHWFAEVDTGVAGNAVPHDDVSVVFPGGSHASGVAPDFSDTSSLNFVENDNDSAAGAAQGASQSHYLGEMIVTQDALIREINANTGERGEMYIDDSLAASVAGFDTGVTNPNGLLVNPIAISAGIHKIEIFMSDFSAFSGIQVEVSYDNGATWVRPESYIAGTSSIQCVKVEKCNGQLFNAVTNDPITISAPDEWLDCAQLSKFCEIEELLNGVIGDPDDPCPCEEVTNCPAGTSILMEAFDNDRGLLQAGETTQYEIFENGTLVNTIVHDYTTTADGVNVSSWYDPIVTAINALSGWSMTVDTDVAAADQGKVRWLMEYTGPSPATLEIVKTPNGDRYTINVDENCVVTGVATDSSDVEIPSPIFFGSGPFPITVVSGNTLVVDGIMPNSVGDQIDILDASGNVVGTGTITGIGFSADGTTKVGLDDATGATVGGSLQRKAVASKSKTG